MIKEIYITDDGEQFDSFAEAQLYERKMRAIEAFKLTDLEADDFYKDPGAALSVLHDILIRISEKIDYDPAVIQAALSELAKRILL